MRKKLTFLLTISFSLLFFIPVSVNATTPANINPGDTFIYEISQWDVPFEDLVPIGEEAPFDMSQFVLDLTNSTLGIKVMNKYASGDYLLDFYVVLGRTIQIPVPEDSPPELTNIFGSTFDLPAGIGIGIGSIPGTDMVSMLEDSEAGLGGVPFYLDPDKWDSYETKFNELNSDPEFGGTMTVTNEAGSDFSVEISGSGGPITSGSIAVTWFREGDNAGVFKKIAGSLTGDFDNDTVTADQSVAVTCEYKSKEFNPLPDFVLEVGDLTLTLEDVQFTYSKSGVFDDPTIDEGFLQVKDTLLNMQGEEVLKFDITSVRGCYYNTLISGYDMDTQTLVPLNSQGQWWDGFTGFPVQGETESISGTDYFGFSIGLIPLGAPGITPDWDMWQASTMSISSYIEIVEAGVEAAAGTVELADMGISLNTFDSLYEMRFSGEHTFFYTESSVDLSFTASDMADGVPEGLLATTAASITADQNFWLSYTDEGELAGLGFSLDASLSLTDFPTGNSPESGTLDLSVAVELQSDKVSSIPDPEKAGTDPDAAGGDGLTPGFTAVPMLMVIAAFAVFMKRRK